MQSAIEFLQDEVLPLIQAGPAETAAIYSDEGRLDHFGHLARLLHKQITDQDLTVAAFLHGVPPAEVRALPGILPSSLAILDDWHALRRLAPGPTPISSSSFKGDPRALVTAIYDCLERLDPSEGFRKWSLAFHLDPKHLAEDLLEVPREDDEFLQRVDQVVAPLARAWGFWMESNVLDNIVLFHRERQKFLDVVDHVVNSSQTGRSRDPLIDVVKAALGAETPSPTVRWEWRHPASIAANLEGINRSDWRKATFRCGFVTIVTSAEATYTTLGRVHSSCAYRQQDLRDFIGESTPAGYKALHTCLLPLDAKEAGMTVHVRIVPQPDDESRFKMVDAERLRDILDRKTPGRKKIRTYTPQGDLKELPPGSTVLNFASSVHAHFVARATHAVVNRTREVGLLHVLSDGDEVKLLTSEAPRPLPEGWEGVVPRDTHDRVRSDWQKGWRTSLAIEGDRWLRRHLSIPDGDTRVVEVLVELAAEELVRDPKEGRRGGSWWLTQLAIHFGAYQIPPGAVRVRIDERRAKELLVKIEERNKALLRVSEQAEIDPPKSLRGRFQRIRLCQECRPGRVRNLVATVVPGSTGDELVLHRPDEPCAEGGLSMSLRDRVSLDQFFVIETNNKVGVALKILAVFEDEGVDIVDVAARRLGPDWGVFRLEVEPIGPITIRKIRRRLEAIENVHSVRTPLETGSALLEAALPPRSDGFRNPLTRPQPYICGPTAIDDQHFYGRDEEIGFLFDLLRTTRTVDSGRGLMCHIRGPLRIGKSSLVLRFQLLLRRRPEMGAIPTYVKSEVDEPWSRLRARLEQELDHEIAESWPLWNEPGPAPQGLGLEETLRLLSRHSRQPFIVLAIDEVNRLFGQSGDKMREIARFRDMIETIPGLLVLWIGPAAGVSTLKPAAQELLLACQPLLIRPFSYEQAMALLEARRLALFHTISLDQNVGRRLFRLTGGEPFLLAHLAQIMWMRRPNVGSRVVRFDHVLAEAARQELLERKELFAVRIEPRTRAKREAEAWAVASLLARDAPDGTHRGLSSGDVALRLGMDETRAARMLETLRDRGALLVHEGEPRRWCIAFPLLSEYLTLHHRNLLPQGPA